MEDIPVTTGVETGVKKVSRQRRWEVAYTGSQADWKPGNAVKTVTFDGRSG
jgi:hypothetical protein